MNHRSFYLLIGILLLSSCSHSQLSKEQERLERNGSLFQILGDSTTNIKFANHIKENNVMNGLEYEYLYNGAGVSVGDLNNDELPDLYFAANLSPNKLYINKGELRFEEVTLISGVEGKYGFHQGTTMVDINADGKLDIYICKSGVFADPDKRRNELYINQGNSAAGVPIFKEEAKKFGLDLPHYSTQASFFDYDKDGDLDMFLINHNVHAQQVQENMEQLRYQNSHLTSDRLYRNDNGIFKDVSNQANIINDGIGFGLGLAVGDINNDTWPDVIVGHDYSTKDRMYINQKDGTFKETINISTGHISTFSMGNDIADINNDGWLDFISVDMVSEDNYGIKASMSGMNTSQFKYLADNGFHYQYMYNTAQLNNGVDAQTDLPVFSDVAGMLGISNTDWSWGPLIFDIDNDGDKDLFVSNGIKRDFRNVDFINYRNERETKLAAQLEASSESLRIPLIKNATDDILRHMPSRKKENYFFENEGNLTFTKRNGKWAPHKLSASNGAAVADLDNDGDLDIITNNMDEYATLYKNTTNERGLGNFLQIRLMGPPKNIDAIGARVTITTASGLQTLEQYLTRGFQSSSDRTLHFGIGSEERVEKLTIIWPNDTEQTLHNITANRTITLKYTEAERRKFPGRDLEKNNLFQNITHDIDLFHQVTENDYDDFQQESLLPHKMSEEGPALAIGDVNNDGLDDFYIGGSKNISGALYIQGKGGSFSKSNVAIFNTDAAYEDVDAVFIDIDNDNDQDLYVVSGGNEYQPGSEYYLDRVYLNSSGVLKKIELPDLKPASGAVVKPFDFDKDGDLDLFVGGRQTPGKYPFPGKSFLFRNDSRMGKVKLESIESELLNKLGMVTDAHWSDIDDDGTDDLIIVGEWMPITILKNSNGKFSMLNNWSGQSDTYGWWFNIEAEDFDNDGDIDLVAGNLGLNSKYKATKKAPFTIYAKDFDKTGSMDIVLGFYQEGKLYPLRGRQCSAAQMPFLKNKFPNYHSFALADLNEVYGKDNIATALKYEANTFATSYFENLGGGQFKVKELPRQTQNTAVTSIVTEDFNKDGFKDLLLLGNIYGFEVETPRQDGGYGMYLQGDGKGNFKPFMPYESGLLIAGEVAEAKKISIGKYENTIAVAVKNDTVQFIKIN